MYGLWVRLLDGTGCVIGSFNHPPLCTPLVYTYLEPAYRHLNAPFIELRELILTMALWSAACSGTCVARMHGVCALLLQLIVVGGGEGAGWDCWEEGRWRKFFVGKEVVVLRWWFG